MTSADQGYQFLIEGVFPGTYRVFAGTDMDNDGAIDEPSEAIGAYPTVADPVELTITESMDGVEFGLAFDLNLPGGAQGSAIRK